MVENKWEAAGEFVGGKPVVCGGVSVLHTGAQQQTNAIPMIGHLGHGKSPTPCLRAGEEWLQ